MDCMIKYLNMKKKVYAYLHTHWDREWYRDKEEFNLRLLEVVDEIINELQSGSAPCFYFDGQTSALEDYLKFRPHMCEVIKRLIAEKKLFIGPFFVSADSFLVSKKCLEKNLEIGMEYSRAFGENEFIGYLSDTFGHSRGIAEILKNAGLQEAIVWRGTPSTNADIVFNGLNTTRLVQGYFMDVLHLDLPVEKRAKMLEEILDKIAKYSGKNLLLPVGADHLAILKDSKKTVDEVNKYLKNYEIVLTSPFEYLKTVQEREVFEGEFLDNTVTYTLSGVYSSRIYQKVKNAKLQWEISKIVEPLDMLSGQKHKKSLDYAYKELIKNHAHDSLYGCSIDSVHRAVDMRFEKVESVLNGVKKRILRDQKIDDIDGVGVFNLSERPYSGVLKLTTNKKIKNAQILAKHKGFTDEKLYDRRQIPVTEDITVLYDYLIAVKDVQPKTFSEIEPQKVDSDLKIDSGRLSNSYIDLKIEKGKIFTGGKRLKFTDRADIGDSYNFAPNDEPRELLVLKTKVIEKGPLRAVLRMYFKDLFVDAQLCNKGKYIEFACEINNKRKNYKLSVVLELDEPVNSTVAEDTVGTIKRAHDPYYSLLDEIKRVQADPGLQKRQELKTNLFPMQRFVWAQGAGIITLGLNEYEIYKNTLSVTLLRCTGLISNPKNPARLVSAGPPLEVPDLQCLGKQKVNFALCFEDVETLSTLADEFYGVCTAFS